MKRKYTRWEKDFVTGRAELHGYGDELIASVDYIGVDWVLSDRKGKEVLRSKHKEDMEHLAEQLQ